MRALKDLVKAVGFDLKKVSEVPFLEARMIIAKELNLTMVDFILKEDMEVDKLSLDNIKDMVNRRLLYEPIAYILGVKEFMGYEFMVQKGVLIPRADSEILCEEVLKELHTRDILTNVMELGVGSGALAVSIALKADNVSVKAVDISDIAIDVSKKNVKKYGVENKIEILKKDILNPEFWNKTELFYDIIYSNPPYIDSQDMKELMRDVADFEPELALYGGADGLDFYRVIVANSCKILSDNALLAFEIGYNQATAVKSMMEQSGYEDLKIINDFSGKNRVVLGRWRKYDR